MAQLFETLCMMLAFKESHSLAVHYCRLVWDVRSLSYINRLATRDLFDSQGNLYRVVDSDLKSALQSKLLEGIARFQLR